MGGVAHTDDDAAHKTSPCHAGPGSRPRPGAARARGRLSDGTWVYAPYGAMLAVEAGRRVVCHVCGDALSAISAQHAARHSLTFAGYRERFGLKPEAVAARTGARREAPGGGKASVGREQGRHGRSLCPGSAWPGPGPCTSSALPRSQRARGGSQGRAAASRDGASEAQVLLRGCGSGTTRHPVRDAGSWRGFRRATLRVIWSRHSWCWRSDDASTRRRRQPSVRPPAPYLAEAPPVAAASTYRAVGEAHSRDGRLGGPCSHHGCLRRRVRQLGSAGRTTVDVLGQIIALSN